MTQSVSAVPVAPGGVDSAELARLLADPVANHDAIGVELFKLAAIVVRDFKGTDEDREDARSNAISAMLAAVPKYDPRRGKAVDFFWTAGQREAWYRGRKDRKQPKGTDLGLCEPKARGIRATASITHGLRPPKDKTPLQLLDIRIKRCQKQLRAHMPEDPAHATVCHYIHALQMFRHDLTRSYLPMELPTVHYTAGKIVTIAT